MKFSVVIPTYNRVGILRQTLNAVTSQTYPEHEILVVDDGSTDETPLMVRREFPAVRLLQQANHGPATARNRGLEAASGDAVAFTDDDCLPPSNWLERLTDGFERHPEVVGVGGPLLAAAGVRAHNLLARYEEYVVRVLYKARDAEVVGGFECPAGGTNNMAYHRDALCSVGGFDSTFPYPAAEDADLKWRLAGTGARFLYIPVLVTHLQPYTWPTFRKQQFVRGKGSVYFDRKWRTIPTRAKAFLRLGYGMVRLLARLPTLPEPALFWPALEELWFNTLGQWAAIGEVRA